MREIKDGIYRAKRLDGSGYVYGYYRTRMNFPNAPEGHFIKEEGQDDWITQIHKNTLMYRINGKWRKK